MTFQPVLPFGGYSGWLFLQRTLDQQQETFNNSVTVNRATEYFRENIGDVQTAEDLVSDRRLREVALGAFGLDEDIDNDFFIQTILDEGTLDPEALANRLSDTRYANLADAFGFDIGLPRTAVSTAVDDIVTRFEDRQFERAVGAQDNDLRLALNLNTALEDVTSSVDSNDARWFAIMGNAPLRNVVQTALGLPTEIAAIDIDQQLTAFQERSESVLGTSEVVDFNDPEVQEDLVRLFLIRSEAASFSSAVSSGSIALTLLQS